MLDIALRNLMYRKLRSVLTMLGIAAPVMMTIYLSMIADFTMKDMTDGLSHFAGQVQVGPKRPHALNGARNQTNSILVLGMTEVQRILAAAKDYDPRRTSPVMYVELEPSPYPNGPAQMTLVGLSPGSEGALLAGLKLKEGVGTLQAPGDAIIGPNLAARYGVHAGDQIEVAGHRYGVRGVLQSQSDIFGGLLLVSLADAQTFTGRTDNVSAVWIGYSDLSRVTPAKTALAAAFPDLEAVTRDDLLTSAQDSIANERRWFNLITGVQTATATIIVILVMYTAVMERTREIGTLRAVGAPRWQVVGGLLQEALLLGALGGILGCIATVPLLSYSLASMSTGRDTLWDWVQRSLPGMGQAFLLALFVSLAAAVYPAWRAARVDPIEALRYE